MRRCIGPVALVVLVVAIAVAGSIAAPSEAREASPSGIKPPPRECDQTPVAFDRPLHLGAGFEPSVDVDSEGVIFVTAPAASGTNELWRSADGGKTFQPISAVNEPAQGLLGLEGDIALDGEDRLYYADTWLVDNHLYRFSDHGETLDFARPALPTLWTDDRPWLAAHHDGFVYLLTNAYPKPGGNDVIHRSTDGGLTFDPVGFTMPHSDLSFIAADPHSDHVYAVTIDTGTTDPAESQDTVYVYVSDDRGASWTGKKVARLRFGWPGARRDDGLGYAWPSIAVSPDDGTISALWGDGLRRLKLARSRDHGATWKIYDVTPFEGEFGHPWVAAGPTGDVGVIFAADPRSVVGGDNFLYGMIWRDRSRCRETGAGTSRCRGPASNYARLTQQGFPDSVSQDDFFQVAFLADNALVVPFHGSSEASALGPAGPQIFFTRQVAGPNLWRRTSCGVIGRP
ncbi:MAG: hypothetical protein M3N53_08010 [Actinomycetota bacterium]|nr:hypothetical protein [Actinomycetota bacterium]